MGLCSSKEEDCLNAEIKTNDAKKLVRDVFELGKYRVRVSAMVNSQFTATSRKGKRVPYQGKVGMKVIDILKAQNRK